MHTPSMSVPRVKVSTAKALVQDRVVDVQVRTHRCQSSVTYQIPSSLHCNCKAVMPMSFFEQATMTAEVASPSLCGAVKNR